MSTDLSTGLPGDNLNQHGHRLPVASHVIVLVAVAFVLFILTLLYIYLNNSRYLVELTQLANTSQSGSKKMQLFGEFAELARGRTRNTIQILETDDVFEQDELNQALEAYAAQFASIREQLDQMPFEQQDRALYDSAFEWVPKILPNQRRAVELIMHDGDLQEARRLIYDIVLPGQQEIINIFTELTRREQAYIRENAEYVNQSVTEILRDNKLLFGFPLLLFTLLAAAVIYRIARVQKQVSAAYAGLEETVTRRTADLQVARDQALHANQAKSEFLSSMSHELRTPLNAVLGFSQLLEMEQLNESQRDSVEEIYKAGRHLLELINEVLDLAKIEAGRMEISLQPVELSQLLIEVQGLARPIAERHGIDVQFDMSCPYLVMADYTRLKQVVINLVSNAIKYNRENGSVRVFCESPEAGDAGNLKLCIADTGRGIASNQRDGLFEPFNRLGAEGSDIEGTGIGMMVTQQFAEMMNMQVDFHSVVGEGSTFWVAMRQMQTDDDAEIVSEITEAAHQVLTGTLKVLCIEDNKANMKFIRQALNSHFQLEFLEADRPSLGLELAMSESPNVILLDVNLPEMDGYQVLQRLKQDQQTRHIPVIAVTASAMAEHVSQGEAADFYAYITKPVEVSLLINTIRQAVDIAPMDA